MITGFYCMGNSDKTKVYDYQNHSSERVSLSKK